MSTGLSLYDSIDRPENGVIELNIKFMTLNRNNDRFEDLANKTPKKDSYLRVHIDVDLKLSPKQVTTAIWKTALNVGKQVVIWWLSGSMVVKTPHPDYPQLPVPPDSIEQIEQIQ